MFLETAFWNDIKLEILVFSAASQLKENIYKCNCYFQGAKC